MRETPEFVKSSGNVFEDLAVENPEDELAKAQLAAHIRALINAQTLKQTQATQRLGTDQSRISDLINGKVSGFTYDRLLKFINAMECDVKIIIEPRHTDHRPGKTLVAV